MAIDVYLQIEGIKGESADSKHPDWIECECVSWGITQPKSATASTSGGHTAERCEHEDIIVHKTKDLSSPILMQTCSAGRTLPRAKLEFFRADGQGDRVKYFEMDQWKNDPEHKPTVSMRHIERKGKNKDGSFKDSSNSAEAFSAIER